MTKPVVLRSIEDEGEWRCVDIVVDGRDYFWVECRRDPEDSHGWRRNGPLHGRFETADAAQRDAHTTLGWL